MELRISPPNLLKSFSLDFCKQRFERNHPAALLMHSSGTDLAASDFFMYLRLHTDPAAQANRKKKTLITDLRNLKGK